MRMALLHNPMILRLAAAMFFGLLFFIIGALMIHQFRSEITKANAPKMQRVTDDSAFAFAAYESVIRKMKEQEQELLSLRKAERESAGDAASVAEAIFQNAPVGILIFGPALTVRHANKAARSSLGIETLAAQHARDVFRGVGHCATLKGEACDLQSLIKESLQSSRPVGGVEIAHLSPSGERRIMEVSIAPVAAPIEAAPQPSPSQSLVICFLRDVTGFGRV